MTFQGIIKYPIIVLLAFFITYSCVPFIRQFAKRLNWVDHPGERRLHASTTPRAGGIAIFFGFHLTCFLFYHYSFFSEEFLSGSLDYEWWKNFFIVSSIIMLVGLIDDALHISWFSKLSGQVLCAVLMFCAGVRIGQLQGNELPFFLDFTLTVFWFLFITNAFNLIDGLDGLATGIAVIAGLGLLGVAALRYLPGDTLIILAFVGSCLAFLRFNFYPASIFLGDSGSLFLGFTFASMGLTTSGKGSALVTIVVPLLAIGVPLFDTVLAVWRRSLRYVGGESDRKGGIATADMEHLHHRLLRSGLNQRGVALLLYTANFILVAVALLSTAFYSSANGIFLITFIIGSYVVVRHWARVELWDSGHMLLYGLTKPTRSMTASLLYPLFDFALIALSLAAAMWLSNWTQNSISLKASWLEYIPIWCGLPFICIFLTGTYNRVWSRARVSEFVLLVISVFCGVLLSSAFTLLYQENQNLVLLTTLHFCFSGAMLCGLRALPRTLEDAMSLLERERKHQDSKAPRVLVVGTHAGAILYLKHEVLTMHKHLVKPVVVGYLDEDRNLLNRWIHGFKVLGTIIDLGSIIEKFRVDQIILTESISTAHTKYIANIALTQNVTLIEWILTKNVLYSPKGQNGTDSIEERSSIVAND